MKFRFLLASCIALSLFSCSTPVQIAYFQDTDQENKQIDVAAESIRLQPGDKISIIVNCQDNKVANLFNLPYIARQLGQTADYPSTYAQGVSGYTIQSDGTVVFPLIDKIELQGLTREEAAARIREELVSRSLVKDPVVTVEYMNLYISILGEVARPGRYAITRDQITLIDALSQAGDLTIFGKRENVRVIRLENGAQKTYTINMCNASEMMSSPAFYLRQNDCIYVEPNDVRQRQSTVNGNNVRSTSFWISLASLATSVTLMIYNLTN